MFLRPGKTCTEAIKFLEDLTTGSLNDVQNRIPHPNQASYEPHYDEYLVIAVRRYDEWVDKATAELHAVFAELAVASRLRGERYLLIIGGDPVAPLTMQLLNAEVQALRSYFNDVANQCRELTAKFSRHKHHSVVLDTNTLLHFSRFDKIPWVQLYGKGTCVVIPHVVVDEIDRKSFAESKTIQKRARGVYRLIEQKLDEIETAGFAQLGDGVTFEILADELGHRRLPNNDDEAVAQAALLQQALGQTPVTVITRDIGMRTRAKTWKLRAQKLPDKYLIREDKLSTADMDEAVKSIESADDSSSDQQG
jgi:rRNA-processing protein FCF1